MTISIRLDLRAARRIFLCALAAQLLLVALHLLGALAEARSGGPLRAYKFVDMDGEGNLPAWFAGSVLLLIAVTAAAIARLPERRAPPSRLFFGLAAALFVFLSLDEVASVHEKITRVTEGMAWVPHLADHRGVWLFVYLPAGVILIAAARRELRALWQGYRRASLILAAGLAVYVGGVCIPDIVAIYAYPFGERDFSYRLLVAGEESLEMLGANLVLFAALRLLVRLSAAAEAEVE